MPWYNDLRPKTDPGKQQYSVTFPNFSDTNKVRTIGDLIELRTALAPIRNNKKTNKNILLASWNIKQFGFLKNRIPDSYFYIAEIISSFDLIAIQELKGGLHDLNLLMKLLGKDWKYIINDVTEGDEGNDERFAYLYDSRRISFSGLAGEIVLWKDLFETEKEVIQLKRTPYITGFKAGWKSFALINLHLQPNDDDKSKQFRKKEVELLMNLINAKVKSKNLWTENLVLIGDFNLYQDDTDIVEIMNDHHFYESDLLKGVNTNTAMTTKAPFDRMFFRNSKYFEIPTEAKGNKGGVIEIFDLVYQLDKFQKYKQEMKDHKENPRSLTGFCEDMFLVYFTTFGVFSSQTW